MKNKKGFTLIELLAVIIILGILMTTAVIGVTRYINDSRRSTYVNTGQSYVNAVLTAVNSTKIHADSPGTLYMVPVGTDKQKSCVGLEKGGKSPFSKEWKYAYVGVKYTGKDYEYFYMSLDGANHAVNFVKASDLSDQGGKLVATGSDIKEIPEIAAGYLTEEKNFYVGTGANPPSIPDNGSDALKEIATTAGADISVVRFYVHSSCDQ